MGVLGGDKYIFNLCYIGLGFVKEFLKREVVFKKKKYDSSIYYIMNQEEALFFLSSYAHFGLCQSAFLELLH